MPAKRAWTAVSTIAPDNAWPVLVNLDAAALSFPVTIDADPDRQVRLTLTFDQLATLAAKVEVVKQNEAAAARQQEVLQRLVDGRAKLVMPRIDSAESLDAEPTSS